MASVRSQGIVFKSSGLTPTSRILLSASSFETVAIGCTSNCGFGVDIWACLKLDSIISQTLKF